LRNECGNPTYNSCGGKDYRYIPEGGSAFISNVDLTKFGEALELPDMQENFMDYFIGNCASNMFTLQQKARVHFCLNTYRPGLWSNENLIKTGVLDPVTTCDAIPYFYSTNANVCSGNSVTFNQNVYNGTATAYNWTFVGGTPATSTAAAPVVTYSNPGSYDVKLSITTNGTTKETTLTNYINVVDNAAPQAQINFANWQYTTDWFEKGYDFVLDAQVSEGEDDKGKFLVFVEMDRRSKVPSRIIELLDDLETLTALPVTDWSIIVDDKEYAPEEKSLKQAIICSPHEYRMKIEREEDLNEMREIAGLPTKAIFKNHDKELKTFKNLAGL
jgi:hypothetical protein